MTDKIYCGIDNGISGTIGIITQESSVIIKTPTKSEQNYTKTKKNITRVDIISLREILQKLPTTSSLVILERPMVNPGRFQATISAVRALEATLGIIEQLGLPYMYIDSKEWQKALLPGGLKGPELKKASKDIGTRLFPHLKEFIDKHGDADSILIAEYCRRNNK